MQDTKWCIENNIERCKTRKREIGIEIAVLQKEREVIDDKQTDLEIILDHYNTDVKQLKSDYDHWKHESIEDKSKLGLLRIWLTENELDMDDIIKTIGEQVK